MNDEQLLDLLLLQTRITIIILVFVVVILANIIVDLLIHLYIKYIKKGKRK